SWRRNGLTPTTAPALGKWCNPFSQPNRSPSQSAAEAGPFGPASETVEKPLRGFPTRGCAPLHRTRRPPKADNSHVCGARSVFSDVHAAGKNGFPLIRVCGRELCEAFLTS